MRVSNFSKRAALVAMLMASVAPAAALAEDTADSRFDAKVHAYLVEHPEVLMEMSQALQARQAAMRADTFKQMLPAVRQSLVADPRDGVAGNPKGDVTIVILQDKECVYCKAISPEIVQLLKEDHGVRVVYKEFPILGEGSVIAAKASLASLKQSGPSVNGVPNKFEAFTNALLADKTPEHQLTEQKILAIARSVNLDVDRLKADMASPDIAQTIADNKVLAQKIGVTGTPGVFINDHLENFVPYDKLQQLVADSRASQKATN